MTTINEKTKPTNSISDDVKFDIGCIVDRYIFCRNNSETHRLMSEDINNYLSKQQVNEGINQFAHSVDYGDNPTSISVGIAIQPHITDTFLYYKIELTTPTNVEVDLAAAMAEQIMVEIDDDIISSISQDAIYSHSDIDSVDDLADVFDDISDKEFMDMVEVINENNQEYLKSQKDDAYKRAMGIL